MTRTLSFASLALVLLLASILVVGKGEELVLGKAGYSVELPCNPRAKNKLHFTWRLADQTRILTNMNPNSILSRSNPHLYKRFDSRKNQWDQGSFPLTISALEMRDSGKYICEVDQKTTMVELQVYKLTSSPASPLLQGESLTLTLEAPPDITPSGKCKSPREEMSLDKELKLKAVHVSQSGRWTCTVSQSSKQLQFNLDIRVLGFQETTHTVYKAEGEPLQFSSPLSLNDERLSGELTWRPDGTSASKSWATFSLRNGRIEDIQLAQELKLQLAESLPIRFSLPKASAQHAGSGVLTLKHARGQLSQTLNLVVMIMALQGSHLVCKVLGPSSSKLHLSLQLENQKARISRQEKTVKVDGPEAGAWMCSLSNTDKALVQARFEVEFTPWSPGQPLFLALVVGSAGGLVVLVVVVVFCCVKCRQRRRQAEKTSQIKRLLSEKKTCQCPHRAQKMHALM
ncbi:T-cell surface glycoprotein CD4 [Thomomys bottae]